MKGSIRIIIGILILFGVAGADCDGDCMENAMGLTEMLLYSMAGLAFLLSGALSAQKSGEFK